MALVITGISSGFDSEALRTVTQLRVGTWVVGRGATGPFLGATPIEGTEVRAVAALPGVTRAVGTVFTHKDLVTNGKTQSVNLLGASAGALGLPAVSSGRALAHRGDIVISTKLSGYHLGSSLEMGGHTFTVVGTVAGSTALAGVPNVFLTLPDAQMVAFAGQPVVSAIAVDGSVPSQLPAGLTAVSNLEARGDLLRPLLQARSTITFLAILLWVVAAMTMGSVIYVSVLERQRDFAAFKATGVSSASILGGLALQAILLSVCAAIIGSGIAALLGPTFPLPVSLTVHAYLFLPVIAVVVGLVASLSGLRRAVSVDPALAFGGP